MPQQTAWWITVVLVLALAAVFLRIVASASSSADYGAIASRATAWRPRLFWALALLTVVILGFTLKRLPYPTGDGTSQVVQVTGTQWAWQLSHDTVLSGQPVEFQVTSADVNHGFAIYDGKGRLLAQVQAMPHYTNTLRYTFAAPGTYSILCLEYCGMVHHFMKTDLIVAPSAIPTTAVAQ
jgi:cytochrome c oxidase subunit 2